MQITTVCLSALKKSTEILPNKLNNEKVIQALYWHILEELTEVNFPKLS